MLVTMMTGILQFKLQEKGLSRTQLVSGAFILIIVSLWNLLLIIGKTVVAIYVKDFLDHHTIRGTSCRIFVRPSSSLPVSSSRCDSCTAYRKVLNAIVSRQSMERSDDGTQANSHTNFRCLTTPEKYVYLLK